MMRPEAFPGLRHRFNPGNGMTIVTALPPIYLRLELKTDFLSPQLIGLARICCLLC